MQIAWFGALGRPLIVARTFQRTAPEGGQPPTDAPEVRKAIDMRKVNKSLSKLFKLLESSRGTPLARATKTTAARPARG